MNEEPRSVRPSIWMQLLRGLILGLLIYVLTLVVQIWF